MVSVSTRTRAASPFDAFGAHVTDLTTVTAASAAAVGSRRKLSAAFVADSAAMPHFDGVEAPPSPGVPALPFAESRRISTQVTVSSREHSTRNNRPSSHPATHATPPLSVERAAIDVTLIGASSSP
jgi:hypothetical protein